LNGVQWTAFISRFLLRRLLQDNKREVLKVKYQIGDTIKNPNNGIIATVKEIYNDSYVIHRINATGNSRKELPAYLVDSVYLLVN